MNIAFLSGLFPKHLKEEIESNSKGGIQYAADTFQWNFVRGLFANPKTPVTIINAPFLGSFPAFYKKLFIKKTVFSVSGSDSSVSVGFCNIAIIKNYFIRKALEKELKKWAETISDESGIIIVYSMHSPWMTAAINVKKTFRNLKLCLIVPDLPEYLSTSTGIIFKLRESLHPDLYPLIPHFDSFVFMTDQMADHFDVRHKPWVTIEGMVNPGDTNDDDPEEKDEKKKIIMYSGTLAKRYGIMTLLNAFELITDDNYELWICGDGDTQDLIIEKAKSDPRIKYHGLITREKVLQLQKRATILINPRNEEGEYTKYSFPSKIMEYLLSGTPCIMYPLPGISAEYAPYFFPIDNHDPNCMKNKITEVCGKSNEELAEFGAKARKFVLKNKNCVAQTQKMINMLTQFS